MVATILKGAASNYPPSARAKIPLHDGWGTVISLNFDQAWLPADAKDATAEVKKSWESPHHLLKREFDRLTVNRQFSTTQNSNKRRVWFPNGIHSMPHTIRMGIDDYGAAPHAIQMAEFLYRPIIFAGCQSFQRRLEAQCIRHHPDLLR